jgi:uncharacterized C2H2 Zn-finger protein
MLVRCICNACATVYDEVVIDRDAAAAPPCPRCGAWLLRIRDPTVNKLKKVNKLHTTGYENQTCQGLPELAAIRRPT